MIKEVPGADAGLPIYTSEPFPLRRGSTQSAGKTALRSAVTPRLYWIASPCHVSHETHLPAEEAQAVQDSWFPGADAHAQRPTHAQAASREGSQAAHSLMRRPAGSPSRARRGRLSQSADFDRVLRQGRSHGGRELVLHVFPRASAGSTRLGLSVSRKVGGAVERNRVKRLLREAFTCEGERLPPGTDVVLVARRDIRELAEREGLSGVRRLLADLISRVDGSASVDESVLVKEPMEEPAA